MSAELRSRLIVAAAGVPLGIYMAYSGGWFLGLVLALVAAIGSHEFYTLASARSAKPLGWFGIPTAVLLVLIAVYEPAFPAWGDRALALLLFLGLLTSAAVIFNRGMSEQPLFSAAATVSGALYTGGTLAFGIFLRALPETRGAFGDIHPWEGACLLIFPLWVTWIGDSAAYFLGKRFGRRKLAPKISPGKTVEGGLAGLGGSILAGAAAGLYMGTFPNFPISPLAGAFIALALGVAGQVGDLAESVLKREAGVKDSGTLLPGHGGALDRFDALFFTIPLSYALILLTRVFS